MPAKLNFPQSPSPIFFNDRGISPLPALSENRDIVAQYRKKISDMRVQAKKLVANKLTELTDFACFKPLNEIKEELTTCALPLKIAIDIVEKMLNNQVDAIISITFEKNLKWKVSLCESEIGKLYDNLVKYAKNLIKCFDQSDAARFLPRDTKIPVLQPQPGQLTKQFKMKTKLPRLPSHSPDSFNSDEEGELQKVVKSRDNSQSPAIFDQKKFELLSRYVAFEGPIGILLSPSDDGSSPGYNSVSRMTTGLPPITPIVSDTPAIDTLITSALVNETTTRRILEEERNEDLVSLKICEMEYHPELTNPNLFLKRPTPIITTRDRHTPHTENTPKN